MENQGPYGNCCYCEAPLEPIWFTEKEYKTINGHLYATGRTRRACSHLFCTECGKNNAVDDSYDGPWQN